MTQRTVILSRTPPDESDSRLRLIMSKKSEVAAFQLEELITILHAPGLLIAKP